MTLPMSTPSKFKVLVTRSNVYEEAIDILQRSCELQMDRDFEYLERQELLRAVAGQDGIYIFPPHKVNAELLDAAGPQLKCVSTASVGFDHIDIDECKKRNVLVGHTPEVLNDCVAEMTIALLLASARRIIEGHNEILRGGWTSCHMPEGWTFGVDIAGSTVGIVGFGRIGQTVAKRIRAFEPAKLLYYDVKMADEGTASGLGAQFSSFDNLLSQSDFVLVCCALTPQTREMFDKNAFGKMKNNAIFVNTSRGGAVNQEDLYSALVEGKIRGAGLDVMTPEPLPANHPLAKLPNVVLAPHNGTATHKCRRNMAIMAARNLVAALEGKRMPGRAC